MITASNRKVGAAIYVHWPFCERKCPYCDFNSHVRERVDADTWRDALLREIDGFHALFPNIKATSIFFGGGTPSLMPPSVTEAVIDRVSGHWGLAADAEITLEANPSSVEAERFKGYRTAGVNRLSVGVQSLYDDALKFLGRLHSAKEARAALKVARDTFDRVSFDLIYARPGMTDDSWREELSEALQYGPDHMSLYQLTIEEGTAFHFQYARGKFSLPDEEEAAALYALTQDMTGTAGLPAYEISNHAKPGQESQHNLAYWQGDYYVGIGPGAHGRLPADTVGCAQAHDQVKRPENWLEALDSSGLGIASHEIVGASDRAIEAIMVGLRLTAGIDKAGFETRFGTPLNGFLDRSEVNNLIEGGFIAESDTHLALTGKGLPLLNFLLPKLLA